MFVKGKNILYVVIICKSCFLCIFFGLILLLLIIGCNFGYDRVILVCGYLC